jgi:regulator of RNase E activity RraB
MSKRSFFSRFFAKSKTEKTELRPKQDWLVFARENLGIITVDKSYSQLFHCGYTQIFRVEYYFEQSKLNDQQMPLPNVTEEFYEIEDNFESSCTVVKLASVVSPRVRKVWFASKDANVIAIANRELSAPEFTQIKILPDSVEGISSLLPNHIESQIAQNKRILLTLMENGDDGSAKRNVRHWIYHNEDFSANALVTELELLGYAISASENDRIMFEKSTSLIDEEIDEETVLLNQIAKKHGVNYDGWETPVVPKANSIH